MGGLKLDNVPSAPALPDLSLPAFIPWIYHGSRRTQPVTSAAVALPLARLIDFSANRPRFETREALLQAFKLSDACQIVVTGTDRDKALERWWCLADRRPVIQGLLNLGVVAVTVPNYSLFEDVPRLDNLYNVKRIALTWSEIQREGLPCAIHLNARTDRDWARWLSFLNRHPEIGLVAVEFGTGAGYENRIQWHVNHLVSLAHQVSRPLRLIVRGGVQVLPKLAEAFSAVSLVDTRPFSKTCRRQRAFVVNGRLKWQKAPTVPGQPIHELLNHNIETTEATFTIAKPRFAPAPNLTHYDQGSRAANDARNEPLQLGLLKEPFGEPGTSAVDGERVVTAAKSKLPIQIRDADEQFPEAIAPTGTIREF
ncbi:MAG: DUF4417 domain-containing protein [Gammaproteobacteria bacterium]